MLFMREEAAGVWLTPISLSLSRSPSPTSTSHKHTGSVREKGVVRLAQPHSHFADCPTEVLVAIAHYVENLRTMACINRLFEDVASYVDFERNRSYIPIMSEKTGFLSFVNASFHRALWSWKHTGKMLLSQKHKMSYFFSLSFENKLAQTQARSLLGFLSTPFTTCPFSSIKILNASVLSLTDIIDLLFYCDNIGCQEVEIQANHCMSRSDHESYLGSSTLTRTSLPPLKNIRYLKIDHPYLMTKEWSFLFKHITAPHLRSLDIRGRPSFGRLIKFLSLHAQISTLCFCSPRTTSAFRSLQSKISLPLLSEIRGQVENVAAILKHLDSASDLIIVDVEPSHGASWHNYVAGVGRALKHTDSLIELRIHIDEEFSRASVKSRLSTDIQKVHNLVSLDISFGSSVEKSYISVSFSICNYKQGALTNQFIELL